MGIAIDPTSIDPFNRAQKLVYYCDNCKHSGEIYYQVGLDLDQKTPVDASALRDHKCKECQEVLEVNEY